jgi:L-asparagine transporter-like permease
VLRRLRQGLKDERSSGQYKRWRSWLIGWTTIVSAVFAFVLVLAFADVDYRAVTLAGFLWALCAGAGLFSAFLSSSRRSRSLQPAPQLGWWRRLLSFEATISRLHSSLHSTQ